MNYKLRVNRFKLLVFTNLIVIFCNVANVFALARPLHDLVRERLQQTLGKSELQIESGIQVSTTSSYEAYIPVQSIEYGFIFNDDYGTKKNYQQQTHKYSLKFKIKSLREITSFKDSKETSEKILQLNRSDFENSQLFDGYWKLVNQLFVTKMVKFLTARKREIESSISTKADLFGLNKVKSQDLLDDLISLQKLENNSMGANNLLAPYPKVDEQTSEKSVKQLVETVKILGEKLINYIKTNSKKTLIVERKQLETHLNRIGKEIAWADDEKLISHIEINHDPFQKEDSYRIAFNIPWLRFDNENRGREKVLLQIKESELAREAVVVEQDLQNRLVQLQTLIEQIGNLKPKFDKLKLIETQARGVKDIALYTSVSQFKFELERELLQNSLSFYSLYLQLLRDMGIYAKLQNLDLLDPDWGSL